MRRRFALGLLGAAIVAVFWGTFDLCMLRAGGVAITAREVAETLAFFAVASQVIALPVALAMLPFGRRWPRFAATLPAAASLLTFAGVFVNVRWLPSFYAPASLAADAAMVALALGLVAVFVRRPWRARGDAALLTTLAAASAALFAWIGPPQVVPLSLETRAFADRAPDVFVILVDTLRADRLGAYGNERPTSPHIDALADNGIVLERAFSSTNWTRPAVASLLTSTMPSRHQVLTLDRTVSDSLPLVSEVLQRSGYQTGFFTVGSNVERSDGYGRGADTFFSVAARHPAGRTAFVACFLAPFLPAVVEALPWTPRDPDAEAEPFRITDHALAWVGSADPDRPLFAYIHYLGPHSPYRPPEQYDVFSSGPQPLPVENPPPQWAGRAALDPAQRQRMIDLYDAEVLWTDDAIGALLEGLYDAHRLDHAIVVLVADHGEAFGSHGLWGHNAGMFRSVVRIPMIFWGSSSLELRDPGRLKTPASLLDVGPTLLELAGIPIPETFDGTSLVRWLRGGTDTDRAVFIENPTNDERSVRTRDWGYFEGRTGDGFGRWLFSAYDDRQEHNLLEVRPELAERLRAMLEERAAHDRSRAVSAGAIDLDPGRRAALEALGYITP